MARPKKEDKGNLFRRPGSTKWQMKFDFMGVPVRKSTGTSDREIALQLVEKEKKEIFQRLMNPPEPPKTTIRLTQAIEDTYTDVWNVEGTTDEYKKSAYRMAYVIRDFLGDIDLSELNAEKIKLVRRHLRTLEYRGKKLTETTVNRYMTTLRCVYNNVAEEHHLPKLRFNIPKKGIENNRVKVYTAEETAMIRQWFIDHNLPDMADLCTLLEYTGFRLSEALGIGKYNKKGKLISEYQDDMNKLSSWENKGDLPRTIPLLPEALTVLKSRGKVPFPSLEKDSASHYWQRMQRRLQLPKEYVMHVFRHTCASRLLKSGAVLAEVQKWLGHANAKTTEIYTHLAPDALDRVAELMVKGVSTVNESVSKPVVEAPRTVYETVLKPAEIGVVIAQNSVQSIFSPAVTS